MDPTEHKKMEYWQTSWMRFSKKVSTVMDSYMEHKLMEDEQTPSTKLINRATVGLVSGMVWGSLVAVIEPLGGKVRLIPSLLMIGDRGLTFASVGGAWFGLELLLEKYRMKRDFLNEIAGGFLAGATIIGYRWRKSPGGISAGISAGLACSHTSVILDHMRRTKSDQKN